MTKLEFSQITQPIDRVVELYNELWLNIRENKNTLTKWISNIFDKCENVEKDVVKLREDVNDLEDKQTNMEEMIKYMKQEIMEELRTEMYDEIREEVMNATQA